MQNCMIVENTCSYENLNGPKANLKSHQNFYDFVIFPICQPFWHTDKYIVVLKYIEVVSAEVGIGTVSSYPQLFVPSQTWEYGGSCATK
jgi:hypothetical protein